MLNLFRAEWSKIAGHRWLTGCLIWIFPIGAVGFTVVMAVILALSESARLSFRADTPQWTNQLVGTWSVLNNPLGRLLLIGFTAVMFAGEYQWQTWKNIIPRSRRAALIITKFVTLSVFVVTAFALMSVLVTLGIGVLRLIVDAPYPPALSASVVRDVAGDYLLSAVLAFTSTLIAAGYAALAGMLTRSILGGILVAYGITFAESLSLIGFAIIAYFLNFPEILQVYRFTPAYNLQNVDSWIRLGEAFPAEMQVGTQVVVLADSLGFSALVLVAWVIGLIGLTVLFFKRQDITA